MRRSGTTILTLRQGRMPLTLSSISMCVSFDCLTAMTLTDTFLAERRSRCCCVYHTPDSPISCVRVHAHLDMLTDYLAGGSVTLRSSNPFDTPKIDLGYLTHPFDLEAIREAARIIRRFFAGPAWSDYIAAPLALGPDDPGFDEQVRNAISSTWHPVGGAAMSAKGAKSGVLDPDLRVKGVKGLRVVDASAFVSGVIMLPGFVLTEAPWQPLIPTGHTQAGVYILAERAADLIKDSW